MFRVTHRSSSGAQKCNCSLWFYIRLWLSVAVMAEFPFSYRSEAAITVFELLMMGGVSPKTCWAIKKHWSNKFYYTVASCWFFLCVSYYDERIHEYQISHFLRNFDI